MRKLLGQYCASLYLWFEDAQRFNLKYVMRKHSESMKDVMRVMKVGDWVKEWTTTIG